MSRRVVVVLPVMLGFLLASSAEAQPFYQGKTIRLIVSLGAGGGTDIYGRLVGRHWGDYIPGKPNVLVANMPAGGGALAFNYLLSQAKPDGLTIVIASQGVLMRHLLRLPGHNYELRKMPLIAASSSGTVHFVSAGLGVDNVADLLKLKRKIKVADTYKGSTIALAADLMFDLLQVNFQHIFGYSSSGEVRLAVLRGEAEVGGGDGAEYNVSIVPLEKKGDIKVLFQPGLLDREGKIIEDPLIPDIPTAKEVYEEVFGRPPSGTKWEAMRGIAAIQTLGKSFWAPPGTSPERLRELEEGYRKMLQSQKYQRDAVRILGIKDPASVGEEAKAAHDLFLSLPDKIVDIYRKFSK